MTNAELMLTLYNLVEAAQRHNHPDIASAARVSINALRAKALLEEADDSDLDPLPAEPELPNLRRV